MLRGEGACERRALSRRCVRFVSIEIQESRFSLERRCPHLRRLPHEVGPAASGADDSGGVTGGVYKARERIHRGMLIRDY